jgi:hypothetical protein
MDTDDLPNKETPMIQSSKYLLLCCLAASSLVACMATDPGQSAVTGADEQTASQASTVPSNVSPTGEVGGSQSVITPRATNATACFQLNNGGATFFINANIDLSTYPYNIVGGNIGGNICDAPNWTLTSGTVGGSLTINGTHTGTGACAATIQVTGNFGAPDTYPGTYGFPTSAFPHRTMFLGFNRACP